MRGVFRLNQRRLSDYVCSFRHWAQSEAEVEPRLLSRLEDHTGATLGFESRRADLNRVLAGKQITHLVRTTVTGGDRVGSAGDRLRNGYGGRGDDGSARIAHRAKDSGIQRLRQPKTALTGRRIRIFSNLVILNWLLSNWV
jgi:hypothetical protein